MRCFPEPRRVGAVVCCPRRLSLCTMHLPEARFGPSVRRGLGAERPSWLRQHGWGLGAEAFARPILLPHEGEPVGIAFRAPENSSKAAGSREPGAAPPGFALGRAECQGENGLRCFPEPRPVGAVVCCPRRLSLCRIQLPESRFGPSVRLGLGVVWPSWLRRHDWGLGPEGLRAPNTASPPRRTRGEWVSVAGDHQQSSRTQGARGSPAQLCPPESGGRGVKTASIAFLS